MRAARRGATAAAAGERTFRRAKTTFTAQAISGPFQSPP